MPRPGPASARGNHESAGKRLTGRTRFANRVLRQALVESTRGAVCKCDCYLAAQYRRLVKRRGDKKAIVCTEIAREALLRDRLEVRLRRGEQRHPGEKGHEEPRGPLAPEPVLGADAQRAPQSPSRPPTT